MPDLDELIRTYTPRLYPIAAAFAAGEDEAEDILQDVWLRAAIMANTLAVEAVGSWLYMATLNEGRSRRRRRIRRHRLLAYWAAGQPGAYEPRGGEYGAAEQRRLWQAIAELPDLQRRALLLRTVDGLTTAETALALGRAEGTVKASLHRAVTAMRRRLGEDRSLNAGSE